MAATVEYDDLEERLLQFQDKLMDKFMSKLQLSPKGEIRNPEESVATITAVGQIISSYIPLIRENGYD